MGVNKISRISGQKKTVALQGSGSLAIEIMCLNFLYGNVTVINTGYYSDRLYFICKQNKIFCHYFLMHQTQVRTLGGMK